ncbi:hypothetical protein GQ600_10117 [Phytophthora cactorum]|nr:hypothetical protein GQ600_10117 [Phytophthora cactorum]
MSVCRYVIPSSPSILVPALITSYPSLHSATSRAAPPALPGTSAPMNPAPASSAPSEAPPALPAATEVPAEPPQHHQCL